MDMHQSPISKSAFMGCVCGKKKLGRNGFARLARQTYFSETDIEALRLLFKKLSGSLVDDGLISKDEFQLGLLKSRKSQSLFADRIFKMFDCNKDGMIEFQEFVRSLSVFHPAASPEEKTLFAFKLYDTGETGFIERGEVKELVCALLKESDLALPGEIVDAIIDRTFEDADQKRDGKIDIEEWKQFVVRYPLVLRNMTIPYLKDMTTAFPNFTVKPEMEDDSD